MDITRIITDDAPCPGETCEHHDPEMPHKHEPRHVFNAAVRITRNDDGVVSLLVNGEEMNMQVLADSLHVTFPTDEADYGTAHVTMTLATDDYEIDLPAAVEVK